MGIKRIVKDKDGRPIDFGAYGCSNCHDAVDGRIQTRHAWCDIKMAHYKGFERTLEILIKKGLIKT